MTKGYVYLLECVSDYETTYKIGYTRNKDITKRIKNLQTGNKDKIKCIDVYESEKYSKKIEISLHNRYSFMRKCGEWFQLDLDDVLNFQKVCSQIEENFNIMEKYDNPFL